jgi:hypothetical protein
MRSLSWTSIRNEAGDTPLQEVSASSASRCRWRGRPTCRASPTRSSNPSGRLLMAVAPGVAGRVTASPAASPGGPEEPRCPSLGLVTGHRRAGRGRDAWGQVRKHAGTSGNRRALRVTPPLARTFLYPSVLQSPCYCADSNTTAGVGVGANHGHVGGLAVPLVALLIHTDEPIARHA